MFKIQPAAPMYGDDSAAEVETGRVHRVPTVWPMRRERAAVIQTAPGRVEHSDRESGKAGRSYPA